MKRHFSSYKGYQCYFNGMAWESQFGSASTYQTMCLKINEALNILGIIRVRFKDSPNTYGKVSLDEARLDDDGSLYIHWDNGPYTIEPKDSLEFLSPVPTIEDDCFEAVTEARVLPGEQEDMIVGYYSYLKQKANFPDKFPKWEDLKLYYKDGQYLT
jgi:hypothetical protein